MTEGLLGLFALAYSGLVLFILAAALRKPLGAWRAALAAFLLSSAVHGVTTLMMGEHALPALAFWGVPHLLILPLLLYSARRQPRGPGA
jgi:hypothetical protein